MRRKCESFEQSDTLVRYVTGKATRDERRAFEDHYLECGDCFNALMVASGVVSELRRPPVSPGRLSANRRLYGIAAGVAVAAVLSGILAVRTVLFARIEAYGAIGEVPVYDGVAVRAAEGYDAQFDSGMLHYAAGRYREAATQLRAALDGGVDPLPAEFFYGICMLKLNRAAKAIVSFDRVLEIVDSPYRTETHYYLAKSLLRLRRTHDALDHLNAIADDVTPIADRARALVDSIQR